MKSKYIIIIALGFFSMSTFAQTKSSAPAMSQLVAISWEITVPSGDKKVINETSLRGIRVDYRKFINDQFSLGFGFSLSTAEELYPTQTYEKPDGSAAVTTDMVRQGTILPITLTAHYYPKLSTQMIKPYIGVGLGAQYASQDLFYNIYVINNSDWGFVARPEIGTLILFGDNIAGLASVGYNYSTNKIDALGISSMKQISFNIGLAFKID